MGYSWTASDSEDSTGVNSQEVYTLPIQQSRHRTQRQKNTLLCLVRWKTTRLAPFRSLEKKGRFCLDSCCAKKCRNFLARFKFIYDQKMASGVSSPKAAIIDLIIIILPSLSTILISEEMFLPILRPFFPSAMDRNILKLSGSSGISSPMMWKGTGSSASSGVNVRGMMLSIVKSSSAKGFACVHVFHRYQYIC